MILIGCIRRKFFIRKTLVQLVCQLGSIPLGTNNSIQELISNSTETDRDKIKVGGRKRADSFVVIALSATPSYCRMYNV